MNRKLLFFNGIDPAHGNYAREPIPTDLFLDHLRVPAMPDPLRPREVASWIDSRSLAESGWGVIVHEHENAEVLEALAPLLNLRRGQAGDRFHSFTFLAQDRCPYRDFVKRHSLTHTEVDPETAPYYLLIVGSPEKIPFDFQYKLDVTHAVGRIYFKDVTAYANYAANVVSCEMSGFERDPAIALFGAENDALTRTCSQGLVLPLGNKLKTVAEGWRVETSTGEAANKKHLESLMGGPAAPALLFTSGHGLVASEDPQRRRREQGSPICSDWEGPGSPLARSHYFGPEDVGSENDFRGSILFHFACYTAGTPRFCNFTEFGGRRELHEKPFVAPLSQRMLGLKRGPLAVIGHVDQAFQYSFLNLFDERLSDRHHFPAAFHKLSQGYPVGAAMEPFNRRFAVIGAKLMEDLMDGQATPTLRLQYWMSFIDSRNYLVLGDPAVRLRVRLPNTASDRGPAS